MRRWSAWRIEAQLTNNFWLHCRVADAVIVTTTAPSGDLNSKDFVFCALNGSVINQNKA